MWSNKVEYSTPYGVYCMMHDSKVPFCVPEFSRSKIIHNCCHVNNYRGELGICYDMIIGRDLMVQLVLTSYFKHKFLQWGGVTVHMKEPSGLLGRSNLNKREMREVVIQTAEPASTIEDTDKMIKIFYSTYMKA